MGIKIESDNLVAEKMDQILHALHESEDSVWLWRLIGLLTLALGKHSLKNSEED